MLPEVIDSADALERNLRTIHERIGRACERSGRDPASVRVVAAGKTTDLLSTRFGIRKIEVDAQHGFRLNGEMLKLKGGCFHDDNGPLGSVAIDRAEERIRDLHEQPRAVAVQGIGAGRSAVPQVVEDREALRDDVVRLPALDVRDEAHAARVVLVARIVEPLLRGRAGSRLQSEPGRGLCC